MRQVKGKRKNINEGEEKCDIKFLLKSVDERDKKRNSKKDKGKGHRGTRRGGTGGWRRTGK